MTNPVKRPELLKESNRGFDFFDFSEYAYNLYENLSFDTKSSITTLVGEYGSGKSVLLKEVEKISKKNNTMKSMPKWVIFECWQYPDKSDLWEGFLLDVVEAINDKSKRDKMEKQYSDIKTWRSKLAAFLDSTKAAIATLLVFGLISLLTIYFGNNLATSIYVSVLIAMCVVLIASTSYSVQPKSKSELHRLIDYKKELKNILKNYKSELYIIIEDVDRAGDQGVKFFETVANFVTEGDLENKNINVIAPIANKSYEGSLADSVDKASDYILYFEPKYNCEQFVSEVFYEKFLDEPTRKMLVKSIRSMLGSKISVRQLKSILRNAIVKHNRLNTVDFNSRLAICIAIELSKYETHVNSIDNKSVYYNRRNGYNNKYLFEWAKQENLIKTTSDDPKKDIKAKEYFRESSEVFDGFVFKDSQAGAITSKSHTYNREFFISGIYFKDI